MPPLRPLTRTLQRPTVHDLITTLLSSQTCYSRPPHSLHSSNPAHPHLHSPRGFSTHPPFLSRPQTPSSLPLTTDRGPRSQEDTQTDFPTLDMLGNTPAPSTSIDACAWDGFHLNNGVKVTDMRGILLVNGEVFEWCPWIAGEGENEGKEIGLVNRKGQWEVGNLSWGVLGLVWPKPDLLILGVGKEMRPLSPKTRQYINSLGIRVDVQDTRNAAAQFNLLATERGVGNVAAALIPLGWRE